jgi:uncharacterized protein
LAAGRIMMAGIRPLLRTFWLGAALLLAPGIAYAQDYNFPKLTGRVVDEANILDATMRADFESRLADLEAKTSSQFVVVTLSSLRGRTIEEYGYQLGRYWGIGQKGSNNGVLLIVAPKERKVRIEVGYGLEGTFPDAIASVIVQNSILPRFRANDYPGGIKRGVDDIVKVMSGDATEFKRPATERNSTNSAFGTFFSILFAFLFSTPGLIFLLFFMHFFFIGVVKLGEWLGLIPPRPKRKKSNWSWIDSTGSGSYSGSGSGWSSSGSSGGGFSGGGGSFGGGGSSGSW